MNRRLITESQKKNELANRWLGSDHNKTRRASRDLNARARAAREKWDGAAVRRNPPGPEMREPAAARTVEIGREMSADREQGRAACATADKRGADGSDRASVTRVGDGGRTGRLPRRGELVPRAGRST